MLPCSLLALFLISRHVSARPAGPSTSTTSVAPSVSRGGPNQNLDAGNLGSMIGGVSAAVAAVVTIILAFAMLRWSRRRKHLYHNNELGEIVPSLPYRRRNANPETASVDSFEFDLPAPALLRASPRETDTAPIMREIQHFGEPPIYSPPTSTSLQPFPPDRSSL